MKIRAKVVALLGSLFIVLGAAQLLVQNELLLPSFDEIERQGAGTDMQRVVHTLNRELVLLEAMTDDWGNWKDAYQYMQGLKPTFISENITESVIGGFRLNGLAFIDLDGKFVWSTAVEVGTSTPIDIDLIRRGALPQDAVWREALRTGGKMHGLIASNRGPMMVAIAPILNGNGQGPHRGALLFCRLLSAAELARIGEQAQVSLAMTTARTPQSTPAAFLPVAASSTDKSQALIEHDDVTEVYRVISDVARQPLLTLRIDVPRDISARGRQVVHYASIFLMGAGALALLSLVWLLNRSILKPLAALTRHAVAIGRSDDLTSRLAMSRNDEIGSLATEFDRMVEHLAAARRQLVDQSFDAGVADHASGVLHNLGNAMTPLGVRIATLQQSLQAAPAGDVDLVRAELANSDAGDAGRRAELVEFLQLTGGELAATVQQARGQLEFIAAQAQEIQRLLADQHRLSRAEKVIEAVRIDELVMQSAELVPAALRTSLSIELEPSLEQLEPVRTARTTLQQVFQNVIINAAEAVRDGGREYGVLRVAAAARHTADGLLMTVSFTDDGIGIAAGDLQRIFAKGYSTKSAATNAGIGLHWCANAIASLGGRIRADSAGSNQGAQLTVEWCCELAAAPPLEKVA